MKDRIKIKDTLEYFAQKRASDPRGFAFMMVNYHIDEVLAKYELLKKAKGTSKYEMALKKFTDRLYLAGSSLRDAVKTYPSLFGVPKSELEHHIRTRLGRFLKS